ncbi:unnamed protein product [Hermetia illucens]|uniref:Thiamine transporter 2 n=2 Tax=Hermetia illucens TaxID=343691 RepID=A0A7R8YPR6_HERIL|nr:unnamed protein product [Hermetia illucens]
MEKWAQLCLLLCIYGFFRELRPSDRFDVEFFVGPDWNKDLNVTNQYVYPAQTVSRMVATFIFSFITDAVKYNPIIITGALLGGAVWCLYLWAGDLYIMLMIIQILHGTYLSAEIAYYTYIYAKVEKEHFFNVSIYTRAAELSSQFLAHSIGQILISTNAWTVRGLNYVTLAAQVASLFVAVILPRVTRPLYYDKVISGAAVADAAGAVADAAVQTVEKAAKIAVEAAVQTAIEAAVDAATETTREPWEAESPRQTEDSSDYTEVDIDEETDSGYTETDTYDEETSDAMVDRLRKMKSRKEGSNVQQRTVKTQTRKPEARAGLSVDYIKRKIVDALDVKKLLAEMNVRADNKLKYEAVQDDSARSNQVSQLIDVEAGAGWKMSDRSRTSRFEVRNESQNPEDKLKEGSEPVEHQTEDNENKTDKATEGSGEESDRSAEQLRNESEGEEHSKRSIKSQSSNSTTDRTKNQGVELRDDIKGKITDKIQDKVGTAIGAKENLPVFRLFKPVKKMAMFFLRSYKDRFIFKWSLWWALASCGFMLIHHNIKIMWRTIDPDQKQVYNGAAEAMIAIVSCGATLSVEFLRKHPFPNESEVWILSVGALIESTFVLGMAVATNIWTSYAMYILFGALYSFLVTYASAVVAKALMDRTYGLIFGFNMFAALVVHTVVTIIVISGKVLHLEIRGQFSFFAGYFGLISGIYGMSGIIKIPWIDEKLKNIKITQTNRRA